MKKGMLHTVLALALVLMLALTPALSLAEQAAEFGTLTSNAVNAAWESGREITAKLTVGLDKLTGKGMDNEEFQAMMAAVSQLLEGASIDVALVKTQDGVRVSIEACLQNQSVISAAAEIDEETVAVETSVLPGKRLTVNTEDFLEMAGIQMPSAEKISAIGEGFSGYIEKALAHYGAVFTNWVEGIEVTPGEGAEATETCDAIARSEKYAITGKNIEELGAALIDAVLEDEELLSFVDELGLTDEEGEPIDLRAQLENGKAEIADGELDAWHIDVMAGYDAADEMVLLNVLVSVEGEDGYAVMNVEQKTDEDGTITVVTNVDVNDGERSLVTYEFAVTESNSTEGESNTSVSGTMYMDEDAASISADVAAEGTMKIADTSESASVQENMLMTILSTGEELTTDTMKIALNMNILTDVDGEDFATAFTYAIDMEANIEDEAMDAGYRIGLALSSAAYVPSTEEMTQVDLLALDQEGLEALITEAQGGLTSAMFTAIGLLPPELLAMMMSSGSAAQ